MRAFYLALIGVLLSSEHVLMYTQSGGTHLPPQPAFEVASVRESSPPFRSFSTGVVGDRLHFQNVTLADCISYAYNTDKVLITGPPWLDRTRYNIEAEAPEHSSRPEIADMLQRLLVERFGLAIRHESRSVPVIVLGSDRGRMKITASVHDSPSVTPIDVSVKAMTFNDYTIPAFIRFLSQSGDFSVDRPFVDETAMQGQYDFTLNWRPARADAEQEESLFTAMHELGFKLSREKRTRDVLVVANAHEHPTSN